MGLMDLLDNALRGGDPGSVFDDVARNAPRGDLAHGVSEALRSDRTPPFGDLVAQVFGQSDADQRAGLLNRIIGALGPGAVAGLAGGALGRILGPGASRLTPEQAEQLSPDEVRDIASEAEQRQPGIVDQIGDFYAEHSGLIKVLGGAALAIALAKMKERAGG